MIMLTGLEGPRTGQAIPVSEKRLTIGKRRDNDLVLDDEYVSRYHASMWVENGDIYLKDEGSTNGTYVNNIEIKTKRLENGDLIQIGSSLFRFRSQPEAVLYDERGAIAPESTRIGATRLVRGAAPALEAPPVARQDDTTKALAALSALARTKPVTMSLDNALAEVLQVVFEVVNAERGCIVLLDEKTKQPIPYAVRYKDEKREVKEDMPVSTTLLKRAIEGSTAIFVPDAQIEPSLAGSNSIFLHNIRCVAYVPFCLEDQVLGLLCVDNTTPGALTETELDVLVALANSGAMVIHMVRLQDRIRRELEIRTGLSRFLAKNVVDDIITKRGELSLGGEEMEISVLFADIRGFTSLAEDMRPKETVALLNKTFQHLSLAVFKHGGTLDKYMGDCIMALFGAPFPAAHHCLHAVMAALDMLRMVQELKQELSPKYGLLALGIGINSGKAVVGNIGSEERMDYTAVGDVVNVAKRLEELAESNQILVSESVVGKVAEFLELRPLADMVLRGKKESTTVYEVTGIKCPPPASVAGV